MPLRTVYLNLFLHYLLYFLCLFSQARLPGPLPVMCRLLVCMNGAPLSPFLNTRAMESLRLFGELANWFHDKFADKPLIPKLSAQMLSTLEGQQALRNFYRFFFFKEFCGTEFPKPCSPPLMKQFGRDEYVHIEHRSIRCQRWQALVLDMLCTLIDAVEDQVLGNRGGSNSNLSY